MRSRVSISNSLERHSSWPLKSFRSRRSLSAVPTSKEALFRNEKERTTRPVEGYVGRRFERAGRCIKGIVVSPEVPKDVRRRRHDQRYPSRKEDPRKGSHAAEC